MSVGKILGELKGVRKSAKGWVGCCPAHKDDKASLSISEANGKILLFCHAGCPFENIRDRLIAMGVWEEAKPQPIAEYHYQCEDGTVSYTIVRDSNKQFKARTEKGWGLNGEKPIPYRLPQVLKANSVLFVEGEKDVETVEKLDLVGTTVPFGAGKWKPQFAEHFKDKRVVILLDNDEPGRQHAETVAASLRGVAKSVRVVKLPVREKGDVSDWVIGKDNAKEELLELIKQTPEWAEQDTGITRLADVEPTEVEYLSRPYLPLRKLTFMDGNPGVR